MQDKVVVITGASDGIGAEAARMLHAKGANVVLVGRSPDKTRRVAKELHAPYFLADFIKLDEIRDLAVKLNKHYPRIDVLINNAGGIFGDRQVTVDGNEKTLQVNHLAHFLLTNLLMDTLIKSKATVINTASIANKLYGDIDMKDLNLDKGYSTNRAYGNSKLANILFTQELHRRFYDKGIVTVAVHPGNIASNFASNTTSWLRFLYRTPLAKLFFISTKKGAEPLVWLASSKAGEGWKSGEYYERFKLGKVNEQAYVDGLSCGFWNASERMTKISSSQ